MLEQRYPQMSAQASALRAREGAPKIQYETLGEHIASMFAHVVALEDTLAQDDERNIEEALATVAIDALAALHDLDEPWCMRTPRRHRGRYQVACELTSDLRHRVQALLHYWTQRHRRDTGVALELVLKSAFELAGRLDFDLGMPLTERLSTREPEGSGGSGSSK